MTHTPTGEPLRIGYVGCGGMAQRVHLPNLSLIPTCEVVALAELRPALGADGVGHRDEIPLRARPLGDLRGRDRAGVPLDDGEGERAEGFALAAHDLDGKVAGKPEKLVAAVHGATAVENSAREATSASKMRR